MQFSIIIPTFENHKYLKTSINSIKKNSKFNHEIIVHINGEDKETERQVDEILAEIAELKRNSIM